MMRDENSVSMFVQRATEKSFIFLNSKMIMKNKKSKSFLQTNKYVLTMWTEKKGLFFRLLGPLSSLQIFYWDGQNTQSQNNKWNLTLKTFFLVGLMIK